MMAKIRGTNSCFLSCENCSRCMLVVTRSSNIKILRKPSRRKKMKDLGIVENWTCEGVGAWLESKDLGEYAPLLCSEHKIDGKALLTLTEDDLRSPPVNITVLGDVKRLVRSIIELKFENNGFEAASSASGFSSADADESSQSKNGSQIGVRPSTSRPKDSPGRSSSSVQQRRKRREKAKRNYERIDSFTPDEEDNRDERRPGEEEQNHFSDISRTMISIAYLWSSLLFTSFVMTLAHDRVPDMKTYPPLPDIILDNIPFIPWAFELCEMCALLLAFMWVTICIFHKHRLILIRRMCALSGTIFLLRAFTMYVTSMSVPGVHLECNSAVGSHGHFVSNYLCRILLRIPRTAPFF